jgi:hypothetical protein
LSPGEPDQTTQPEDEDAAAVVVEWTAEDQAMLAGWLDDTDHHTGWTETDDLIRILATAGRRDGDSLVAVLRAHAAMEAHHQARMYQAMMAIVDDYTDMDHGDLEWALEGAAMEVRAALSLTRRAAEHQVQLACDLGRRLPDVLAALGNGVIDLAKARVIIDGTSHLDPTRAHDVTSRVLDRAQDRTTGQLRALIRKLCVSVDPDDAARRYHQAVQQRVVFTRPDEAGTATLIASDLPPERAAAVMDRLTGIAHNLKTTNEPRTIDQLRTDIFLDLLEGTGDHQAYQRRGVVDIRVDLTTLVGLDDNPGELAGYGPVIADITRQIATRHGSQWRTTVTNRQGDIVHSGTTRRRPDARTRRLVETRDQTCVFPGCRMPARNTDLDHRTPHSQGGETNDEQLVAVCRHHHVNRHEYQWKHVRNPDGSHTWTSPLGNTYTRPPPD